MPVQRLTLFKVLSDANIPSILEAYQIMAQTNQKNGKPYISNVQAHRTVPDPRTGGYNVVASTQFESLSDVTYYDESCSAHKQLKESIRNHLGGPPMAIAWET